MRHFLNLMPHPPELLRDLLTNAARLKKAHEEGKDPNSLCGKVVGMVFEKPSLRTRVSFEAGIAQLGGTSIFIPGSEIQLGQRESLADFARTMSQYVNGLVLRVFRQETCDEVSRFASVPVINGLSDISHPCQAMADLQTIEECFGTLDKKTVVFVGDGNNVARSLAVACGKMNMKFILAAPKGYEFEKDFLQRLSVKVNNADIVETNDPIAAVKNADVIYTDVWTSMGQEAEREIRLKTFEPYQVNEKLLSKAPKHVRILHCLPAHRGEEISNGVLEGPASVVFQQAGNRLHAQKAILEYLLGGK
ncbi:ornithine carbamoyltransferase [Telmatocola sphagniphila]|uniref:Ornithine carbamoyltransferase n=1 Tax=Telmatocola sphagniphila TaxID=1123043 RepID=A0A8E6B9G3_9BACT|nr:ornithine carbamoyltransferase [Telmatocola sphagniphila]QVL34665.1 ornithine carbamoyltransferase [Telmatocola sphagniphila]